jgi:hypothetical protein
VPQNKSRCRLYRPDAGPKLVKNMAVFDFFSGLVRRPDFTREGFRAASDLIGLKHDTGSISCFGDPHHVEGGFFCGEPVVQSSRRTSRGF